MKNKDSDDKLDRDRYVIYSMFIFKFPCHIEGTYQTSLTVENTMQNKTRSYLRSFPPFVNRNNWMHSWVVTTFFCISKAVTSIEKLASPDKLSDCSTNF